MTKSKSKKNKDKKESNNKIREINKDNNLNIQEKKEAIPKPVANRMARRIAFTTGFPTLSGMGVFIGSYFLISEGIADIPPSLTLLISAACFLLGLIGLSYGILSASWEKEPGSLLGLENIRPNIARMKAAFQTESK